MLYCNVINNEIVTAPRPLPNYLVENNAIANNWYPVIFLNRPHDVEPECNPITHKIEMSMRFEDNKVVVTHIIVEKFSDEIEKTREILLHKLRADRKRLLLLSDWTQLPNAYGLTQSDKLAWENYRQELRDFPNTVDLSNVIWPTSPFPLDNA